MEATIGQKNARKIQRPRTTIQPNSTTNTTTNPEQEKPDPEITELVNLINDTSVIGSYYWDQDFNINGLSFMSYRITKSYLEQIKETTLNIDLDKLAKKPKLVASYAHISAQSNRRINPWWTLLDSQLTVDVFSNPKLLKKFNAFK